MTTTIKIVATSNYKYLIKSKDGTIFPEQDISLWRSSLESLKTYIKDMRQIEYTVYKYNEDNENSVFQFDVPSMEALDMMINPVEFHRSILIIENLEFIENFKTIEIDKMSIKSIRDLICKIDILEPFWNLRIHSYFDDNNNLFIPSPKYPCIRIPGYNTNIFFTMTPSFYSLLINRLFNYFHANMFSYEVLEARVNNVDLANSCFEDWVKNEWNPNSTNVLKEIESAMAELNA